MIFVSQHHPAFDPGRKPARKRYGRLIQSPEERLQEIMDYHQSEVKERLLDLTESWRDRQSIIPEGAMLNGTLDSDTERELRDELDEMDVSHDYADGGKYY